MLKVSSSRDTCTVCHLKILNKMTVIHEPTPGSAYPIIRLHLYMYIRWSSSYNYKYHRHPTTIHIMVNHRQYCICSTLIQLQSYISPSSCTSGNSPSCTDRLSQSTGYITNLVITIIDIRFSNQHRNQSFENYVNRKLFKSFAIATSIGDEKRFSEESRGQQNGWALLKGSNKLQKLWPMFTCDSANMKFM